jgi:hypothetical protein
LTRVSLLKTLAGVALAALLVCALDALSGAAEGVDGGGPAGATGEAVQPTSAPDAAVAPPAGPESGPAADRRRPRRYRRWGAGGDTGHVDAGAARDAPLLRVAARDGGFRMAGRDGGFRMASRDAGFRLPVVAPPVVPPPPPPPPPTPSGPSTSLPVTELGFNTCQKVPAGKRVVKVNLKPDVELPELVAWISSITCKSFVLPGHLGAAGKKLTFITQGMLTRDEAYAAFLNALDSVGLAVERGPGYYKIIEASKAKSGALPVYGFDGKPTQTPPKRAKE